MEVQAENTVKKPTSSAGKHGKYRKKGVIARYFSNFGLNQVCDIMLVAGAIVLIVGLSIAGAALTASKILLGVGFGMYIVATAISAVCSILVLTSKKIADIKVRRRSPEYKRAVVTLSVACVLFALGVFGLIWLLVA